MSTGQRFVHALKKSLEGKPRVTDADVDSIEESAFDAMRKTRLAAVHAAYKTDGVPLFYRPRDTDNPPRPLLLRLQEEGRNRFLLNRSQNMWDDDKICALQEMIMEHRDPTDHTLSWVAYEKVQKSFYAQYPLLPQNDIYGLPGIDAARFLKLSRLDRSASSVSSALLLDGLMRDVFMYQTRVDLVSLESECNGVLREQDLETFLKDAVPMCGPLENMPPSLVPFYICGAIRRFAHFVKPLRYGKCSTGSVLMSLPMEEFTEVALAKDNDSVQHNWFGLAHSMLLYEKYAKLDTDHDGMLSLVELRRYKKGSPPLEDPGIEGTFTDIFVERFFDVTTTYGGLVDYKKYVDFVLLVETLPTYPNLEVLWRIFDIHGEGYLSPLVLNLFLREVNVKLAILNMCSSTLENLVVELLDLLGCGSAMTVTKADFFESPSAGLFSALLIDYHALVIYEQREAQIAHQISQQGKAH